MHTLFGLLAACDISFGVERGAISVSGIAGLEVAMNHATFVKKLPMRIAQTGCRFNLRFYVYSKGNGFLYALDGDGKIARQTEKMTETPYAKRQSALAVLGEILERAERHAKTRGKKQHRRS